MVGSPFNHGITLIDEAAGKKFRASLLSAFFHFFLRFPTAAVKKTLLFFSVFYEILLTNSI